MADEVMIPEFVLPDFLAGSSPDEIHERMMNNLPADIDRMPGGFPWDFTRPTALEKSELIQFHMVRTLMLMFPMWAWDDWLDYHAMACGLARRAAAHAVCKVRITGTEGTVIAAGTKFATAATSDSPSLYYSTMEDCTITDGAAEVYVQADEGGTKYNVPKGTIVIQPSGLREITSVTNIEDATGGTEPESDEELRERIQQVNTAVSSSYIGNDSDYIRWAKEVEGIGDCVVIPTWNGPGTVKLVLTDSNGKPANEKLIQAVYGHIVSPDDRSQRLLPTACADLTIVAATSRIVSYTCTGLVYENTDIEQIKNAFLENLQAVYTEAQDDGVLRYNQVRPILTDIPGVVDFGTFLMDGGIENIPLSAEECPETSIDVLDFS